MPSDIIRELGIKKSKSGIKEKKLYDEQGLYTLTSSAHLWQCQSVLALA